MLTLRRSADRGHFDHGWLDARHTFSFGDYRDPAHMGFRALRVINEDRVQPGTGFPTHPHRDMEIITYVLSGELRHEDSLGNGAVIRPGQVQYMAAGSGVLHSEFNPSPTQPVHLMQIWMFPSARGLPPRYEQRDFPGVQQAGGLTLLASGDEHDGSIRVNLDARLWAATLAAGQSVTYDLAAGRGAWLQVLRGELTVGEQRLAAGDGASVEDEPRLKLQAVMPTEVLLFDLG